MDGDDYFDKTTDTSFYNDIMRKPEYMFWNKGYVGKIIYITPIKYFELCARMQRTSIEEQESYIDKNSSYKYMEDMLKGDKFPMPFIDYSAKRQEGRHRSYAIKMINPAIKMPVLIVSDRIDDKNFIVDLVKKGESFDDFVKICKHMDVPYNETYYIKIKNNTL